MIYNVKNFNAPLLAIMCLGPNEADGATKIKLLGLSANPPIELTCTQKSPGKHHLCDLEFIEVNSVRIKLGGLLECEDGSISYEAHHDDIEFMAALDRVNVKTLSNPNDGWISLDCDLFQQPKEHVGDIKPHS